MHLLDLLFEAKVTLILFFLIFFVFPHPNKFEKFQHLIQGIFLLPIQNKPLQHLWSVIIMIIKGIKLIILRQ